MDIKKHVGRIKSTEQRCVIVFKQLPETPGKALIINTESLQPFYEQLLMDVVDSPEGQQANELAFALSRRMVPEAGRTILEEFHARGLLRTESIDNIVMLPRPNTPFELRDIVDQINAMEKGEELDHSNDNEKYNPIVSNMSAASHEEKMAIANNLIAEAQMLEIEAKKKRDSAYAIAPELRDSVTDTVEPITDAVEEVVESTVAVIDESIADSYAEAMLVSTPIEAVETEAETSAVVEQSVKAQQ